MNLAIVGSREYQNLSEVKHYVRRRLAEDPTLTIISGGARGVDTEAERAAEMMGAAFVSFRPLQVGTRFVILRIEVGLRDKVTLIGTNCSSYGAVCFARNRYIVREADEVVPFWDGKSSGTKNTIDLAREAFKLVEARAA